jgi:hypothetical protein
MKFILALLLLVSPTVFFGQKLSGLWMGTLTNDSSTVRKDESFEIALSEYRGKVTGYSRSTFIVNDTLYYIVKRVKGVIDGNVCELKDDEIVSYNFPKKLDKGIKVISTFRRNLQDSTWYLVGDWKTTQTKKYYAISGKVDLKEEQDYSKSKLFPHLEELNIASQVPFYQEAKTARNQPVLVKTNIYPQHVTGLMNSGAVVQPDASYVRTKDHSATEVVVAEQKIRTSLSAEEQQGLSSAKANVGTSVTVNSATAKPVSIKEETVKLEKKNETSISVEQQSTVKTTPVIPSTGVGGNPMTATSITISQPKIFIPADPNAPAAFVEQRSMDIPQVVNYVSDSLELALYDNGEVDGDTVSVLLNGQVIMAKQGLKTTAIRQVVHITPGNEDLTLILYAENLGKYPPNTGLLVVYDGEQRYQIRFSADLNKNASIVFRRKK